MPIKIELATNVLDYRKEFLMAIYNTPDIDSWRAKRGYPTSTSSANSASSASSAGSAGSTGSAGSAGSTGSATSCGSLDDPFYTGNGYEDIFQSEIDAIMGDPVNRNSLDGHNAELADRNGESHGTHVVQSGESLWSIAKRLLGGNASNAEIQAKVNELAAKNGIRNPNRIYPGQQINY